MRINTNIPALQSYNALTNTNNALQKSINKLSTGLRINAAADDAAGLAISEKMRAQYRGLDQATTNAQDGISMIQTAEGALNETHSILQRMRELAVQAANDTLTQEDRSYIQLEIDQLKEEITRISSTTQFNKKQLLDGSAAAVWSSSDLQTRALINGGLRVIDQFGQKNSVEGNYKITVKATPGEAQIQKSDIFKIKHKNVVMNKVVSEQNGIQNVRVDNMPAGEYRVDLNAAQDGSIKVSQAYVQKYVANGGTLDQVASAKLLDAGLLISATFDSFAVASGHNQSMLFEVAEINNDAHTVRFNVYIKDLDVEGNAKTVSTTEFMVNTGGMMGRHTEIGWTTSTKLSAFRVGANAFAGNLTVGDKFTFDLKAAKDSTLTAGGTKKANTDVAINGTINSSWGDGWTVPKSAGGYDRAKIAASYSLNATAIQGKEIHFEAYYINEQNGTVHDSSTMIEFTSDFKTAAAAVTGAAYFEAAYIGQIAKGDVQLRDIDKFWDANGKFLLDDPKTLTVTQGDGKTASVTIYSTDTIDDVRSKLNGAIATGLGQGKYVTNSTNNFVTFVEKGIDNTSESVVGTFLIRSLVPGSAGTLSISGDEDVVKAFSLNVIQQPKETKYELTIVDAHNGNMVESGLKITGNKAIGVIHDNIDIVFDPMANIDVTWNEQAKRFSFKQGAELYSTILHLADNTTVFQIGANQGEDMGVNIGNMSAEALGLGNLIVTDRENAARSITVIDNAIGKVSFQRAKLGAYQNRLEHTINNLTTASTNLKSSESRIRDADMAKEMMEFTKLNILSQAGNSMLAQANQLPQNVLTLLR